MRFSVPLAGGMVVDTPARLIDRWSTSQSAAPAAAPGDAAGAAPGAVAAGDAGPAPLHADNARITIATAAAHVGERISASVPSDRRARPHPSARRPWRGTPLRSTTTRAPSGASGNRRITTAAHGHAGAAMRPAGETSGRDRSAGPGRARLAAPGRGAFGASSGLSLADMRAYLEHVADRRLAQLGIAPYGSANP